MFRRRRKRIFAPKARISHGQPLSLWERHLERGLDFFGKGKLDDALADLDEAIHDNPRNGELYATRGMILIEMKQEDDAKEDLDHALKIDARQWLVHYVQGLLAFRRKNYDEAIEHLSTAQRFAPLRHEIFFTRAAAHYALGNLERARDDLDNAMQTTNDKDKRHKLAKKHFNRLKREIKAKEKKQKQS